MKGNDVSPFIHDIIHCLARTPQGNRLAGGEGGHSDEQEEGSNHQYVYPNISARAVIDMLFYPQSSSTRINPSRPPRSAIVPLHHRFHRGDSLQEMMTQAITRPDYFDQYWRSFEQGHTPAAANADDMEGTAEEEEEEEEARHPSKGGLRKPLPREVLPQIFAYAGATKVFRIFTRKHLQVRVCQAGYLD